MTDPWAQTPATAAPLPADAPPCPRCTAPMDRARAGYADDGTTVCASCLSAAHAASARDVIRTGSTPSATGIAGGIVFLLMFLVVCAFIGLGVMMSTMIH